MAARATAVVQAVAEATAAVMEEALAAEVLR